MAKQTQPQVQERGTVEVLLLEQIQFDETYQRPVKPHAKRIAKQFDDLAAGIPTVARRPDGTLWGIDGRQRFTAMTRTGVDRWRCFVVPSSGPQFEAQLFSKINRDRVTVSQGEQFHAALVAGDPVAVAAMRAVESCGLRIPPKNPGERGQSNPARFVSCHGTIYQACATYGEEVLARTLRLLRDTWPGDPEALKSSFVAALSGLLAQLGKRISDERFARMVGKITTRQIQQDALLDLGGKVAGLRRSILRRYNVRLSNKLSIDKVPAEE